MLARYFGVAGSTAEKAVADRLWQLSDACTPDESVDVYTQAIMDLGATVCTRRKPLVRLLPAVARLRRQGDRQTGRAANTAYRKRSKALA